jgi:hypothetical protein
LNLIDRGNDITIKPPILYKDKNKPNSEFDEMIMKLNMDFQQRLQIGSQFEHNCRPQFHGDTYVLQRIIKHPEIDCYDHD